MRKRSIQKARLSIIAFIFALGLTGAACGGGSGGGSDDSDPPANRAPVVAQSFAKVQSLEDIENYVQNVRAHFSDPDGDALDINVSGYTDVNAVLDGDTIVVSQATPGFYGSETGSVEACDPSGECVTAPLEVEVVQNTWPGIGSITVLQAQEGQIFYGQVNADDPDLVLGDSLTYELLDNSNFSELRIDPVTGELFTDDPLDFLSAGDHDVQIGVLDSFGGEFSDWYTLTVADTNRAPVIDDVYFDSTPTEGEVLLGSVVGHDDDGDSLECYLISSTLPELHVTPHCSLYSCNSGNTCFDPGTGTITPDPLPQAGSTAFDYEVGLTDGVEDDTWAGTEEIQRPPTQPTSDSDTYNMSDNDPFPLEFYISSTDPNPGDVITYQASGIPSGATFNTDTGLFSWDPTCSQDGIGYTIGFKAVDDKGNESTLYTVVINVTDDC